MAPPALPRKPNVVVAFGGTLLVQSTLRILWLAPLGVLVPPQIWVIACPFANVQVTFHPAMVAELVLRTATSPWKPPVHWPTIRYVAVQPGEPVGPVVGDVVVGGVVGGVVARVVGGVVTRVVGGVVARVVGWVVGPGPSLTVMLEEPLLW